MVKNHSKYVSDDGKMIKIGGDWFDIAYDDIQPRIKRINGLLRRASVLERVMFLCDYIEILILAKERQERS